MTVQKDSLVIVGLCGTIRSDGCIALKLTGGDPPCREWICPVPYVQPRYLHQHRIPSKAQSGCEENCSCIDQRLKWMIPLH